MFYVTSAVLVVIIDYTFAVFLKTMSILYEMDMYKVINMFEQGQIYSNVD